MRRPVLAMLLVLAILEACAPADGADPRSPTTAPAARYVAVATPTTTVPATRTPQSSATGATDDLPDTPAATPTPAFPEAAATPEPEPSTRPSRPPKNRPYAINLANAADFVPQYTFEWCVGASIQMARSIIKGNRNESRASQRRLWELAREHTIDSPYGGANPVGWAAALNALDLGPYRLVSLPTFDDAVRQAAQALAETGRPVGLVMWSGRHAWLMTGFKATADPRRNADARITRVRVMDPLYPHGSRWGRSPAPNQLITPSALAHQFVRRDRPDYDFGVDPGWLLVLPVG